VLPKLAQTGYRDLRFDCILPHMKGDVINILRPSPVDAASCHKHSADVFYLDDCRFISTELRYTMSSFRYPKLAHKNDCSCRKAIYVCDSIITYKIL